MTITADTPSISTSITGDPTSWSHTVGSGATVLYVIYGNRGGTADPTSVTWNGTGLTKKYIAVNGLVCVGVYERVAPAAGTYSVQIDWNGTPSSGSAFAVSLYNTDLITPWDGYTPATGTGRTSMGSSHTPVVDKCWVLEGFCWRISSGETITQGSESGRTNWSPDWENEPGGNTSDQGGSYYADVSPAGSKAFSWSGSGSTDRTWAQVMFSVRPGLNISVAECIDSKLALV